MAKVEYRSSLRSKRLIKQALAKLLHEKEISKITVSDIIREADISRGTFYAHYNDVAAVAEHIESEELESLKAYVESVGFEELSKNPAVFIAEICKHIGKDKEYYKRLMMSNILDDFLSRMINMYYDCVTKNLNRDVDNSNSSDIYLVFSTNGAKMVLVKWICGELNCTNEDIAEQIGKYLLACTDTYYNK